MLKTVLCCACACGLSYPAVAGERSGVAARPLMVAALIKDPAARLPASGAENALPQRFMLPVGSARLERMPETGRAGESLVSVETQALDPEAAPEVTARAGGRYAVYDILRNQPRPRFRGSPLSTALVLKLDGNDESPAFSVGGGGVAAVMWKAVPR